MRFRLALGLLVLVSCFGVRALIAKSSKDSGRTKSNAATADWAQWGGSPVRNNTPEGHNIPTTWNIGKIDYRTGTWDKSTAKNVKWVAKLGSQSYGNPVVGDGKVFMGTNNGAGHLKRFPPD